MSSLAAARADNFYIPPDHDPSKGGINAQQGTHALGKRAKHIDKGVITIRFEAPFHIWCSGCGFKISKGCRFNAQKKAVGNYHSTKIWSFKMVTPCCANELEIHTDPKLCDYVVVAGGTKKMEEYSAEDAGTMELPDKNEIEKRREDPFHRLEYGGADARRAAAAKPRLEALEAVAARSRDDYALNKALRRNHRGQRKEAAALEAEGRALGLPEHIPLLPQSEHDLVAARRARAAAAAGTSATAEREQAQRFHASLKLRRGAIMASSIFSTPAERAVPRGALLGMGGRAGAGAGGSGVSGSAKRRADSGAGASGSGGGAGSSAQRKLELLAKRQRLQSALKS